MVLCGNCGQKFENDENVPLLYEAKNGKVYTEFNYPLSSRLMIDEQDETKIENDDIVEVYHGCNVCLTDGYLVDMEDLS